MKAILRPAFLAVALGAALCGCSEKAMTSAAPARGVDWGMIDVIVKRIEAPRIPDRTFVVQGVADGVTDARPAILNAANEVAVAAFLDSRVGFLEIAAIVADTLDRYDPPAPETLDDVLAIDAETRTIAGERVKDCVN